MRDESSQIVQLSTRDVAPADRLSYASWILDSALAPSVLSTPTPSEYKLDVSALALPSIAIVAAGGSPSRSIRGPSEIRRSSQRYFALALVPGGSSRNFTSVTRDRFGPGDLIFYDSRNNQDCNLLSHWSGLNLQLSEQFVRRCVPNPSVLSGRRIGDSQWGRVLASYVAQLSPEFVVQAPLPQGVLIDQLGALLALTASELSGRRAVSTPTERSARDHVYDRIRQRCADTSLQAADVASLRSPSEACIERWRRVATHSGQC